MSISENFLSPFGGFWTDTQDAGHRIHALQSTGNIDEQEAERLSFWVANGYVVIPAVLDGVAVDSRFGSWRHSA